MPSDTCFNPPERDKLTDDQIQIRQITLKDLDEFARNALRDPVFADVAPISLLRAGSQAKNPQGAPDDIALLVALHKNRCVGYHGLLPGWLRYQAHVSKIYWLITFYLNEASRGRGWGKRLVNEIQNTGIDLVTTGITVAAAGVYRSAGFRQLAELPYCQLRPKNISDLNGLAASLKSTGNPYISKCVNQLSAQMQPAATRPDSAIAFQRDVNLINWMIRNPWVVSEPDARADVEHYYFSRVRELFKFIPLEIFAPDGKTRRGYLVLSVSRKKGTMTLKVLDYCFHDPKDIQAAAGLAVKYAADYRADRLEYPVDLAAFFENRPELRPLIKKKKRQYLFYPQSDRSPLAKLAHRLKLNYCDSDTAFT